MIRKLRQLPGDERGPTAVEFALLSIPLFVLLIEVFDFGLGIWTYNNLSEATRAGARYAIVRGSGSTLPGALAGGSGYGSGNEEENYICSAPPPANSVSARVCQYAFPLDRSKLSVTADWDSVDREVADPVIVKALYAYTPLLAGVFQVPNMTINLKSQSQMVMSCCQ